MPYGILISSFNKPFNRMDNYLEYIKKGFHAESYYLSDNESIMKKETPYLISPFTKSILTFSFLYKIDLPKVSKNRPRFAMYSQMEDYHHVLYQHIKKFLSQYSLYKNFYKIYIDTGPLWEKEIAYNSGLGWIGKNSMLINKKLGSFTFLGEALVDTRIDFTYEIQNDLCGNCNLCINSCPTNAIDMNRNVDSNKCISYHTIESKKIIPFEIGRKMDNWVFGCDICNQVCPWNKLVKPTNIFKRNDKVDNLNIEDLAFIDQFSFQEYFSKTPVKRAKIEGIRRNAVIAHFNVNNDDKFLNEIVKDFDDLGAKQAKEILNNMKNIF